MITFFYNYIIILCFFFTSILICLALFSLTFLLSKKMKEYKKLVAYECGFNSYSSARIMFDVHFFIVALLFLVFDVELVFLYPWSLTLGYLSSFSILAVYGFLFIIIVGYVYEWKKGALNWTLKF